MTQDPMWTDRIRVQDVVTARRAVAGSPTSPSPARDAARRYWSTPPRPAEGGEHEVLQVDLVDRRLVNYVSLEVAHFPHVVTAEYQDPDTQAWLPLEAAGAGTAYPVSYRVFDSAPSVVDVASPAGGEHPQHHGPGHWVPVVWRCRPVTTRSVRLILARQPTSAVPTDPAGRRAPYSLGARLLQIGYRISSLADVPRYGDVVTNKEDFASSTDILGSRVTFSLRSESASSVLTPVDGDYWRCAPQPVNYAVVCLYADVRGADGEDQVVDRWFLDPLTVGPTLNLYYSSDEPVASFEATDDGFPYPALLVHGIEPVLRYIPPSAHAEYLEFAEGEVSFLDIDNAYLQWEPRASWWIGGEVKALCHDYNGVSDMDPGQDPSHPVLSTGGCVLETVPGLLRFTNDQGEVAEIPLDPDQVMGATWRFVVGYNAVATEDYPAGLVLAYQLEDRAPTIETFDLLPCIDRPPALRLGGFPDDNAPGIAGIGLRALILKVSQPTSADLGLFLADPQGYVHRPAFAAQDQGTTDDSLLRLDPLRIAPEQAPHGLFGGPADRYAGMVWTPVARDFRMYRGYLHVPPTRARYWKFEMTNLAPEPYEAFVPISRTVQVFTTSTVQTYQAALQYSSNPRDGGHGAQTSLGLAGASQYSDQLGAVGLTPDPSRHTATEALYAPGLADADRLAGAGWVWGFQPWHSGGLAPRFITATQHVYERVQVSRTTKVAFFAGIKSLRAFRLDYAAEDDVEQYLDYLDDLAWVDTTSGVEYRDGTLVASSSLGEVVSKPMATYRPVRAVQYATQQSDAYQVLPDDTFTGDFDASWVRYGDAEVTPGAGRVVVTRGWRPRDYEELESGDDFGTYDELEGMAYGEIEGGQPDGVAGGGVQSLPLDPSSSGRLYAAVRVSSASPLTYPLSLQVMSALGDVVLASADLTLSAGEVGTAYVGYTVGSAQSPLTYGTLEGTSYGTLEGTLYSDHESVAITGPVYVRAVQLGPSQDEFVITRLSLYDDPIQWAFSVDGGDTWWDAYDVRNDPSGVLTLPDPGAGIMWRARMYREGAYVSAIAIRPWYSGLLAGLPHHHQMSQAGPNRSPMDHYPPVERDPMWQQWGRPIPRSWYTT